MPTKDLVFRFIGADSGAGREFDRMAGKSASLEKTIGKLGVVFAGTAVAFGVESVRMAAKFQQSMEVIHTQAGASQREVEKMSKAVLALAGPTATAPETLAAGLYHLESAGFRGQKALEALRTAAEGAKVGGANLEDVTNALNATLVSGIKGAQNMSAAMGALNATVGAGDMRMQDLAEAMGTGVLAAVRGFGLSLNDVGAALATFGDNNIRGADAATQLRMAVLFMAKPAATAKATLKDLGMTSHTLATDMGKGGLGLALQDLHDRLIKAGDTGSKMGQVLLDMFGHKAGTGIAILEQQYTRFQQKQDEVAHGSRNFASDWKAYTQTFGYSWDRAQSAFQSMTIQLGTKLLPTATKAMNWIGTKGVADLDKFSGWVSRNKTPIEDIAKAIAAIAAIKFVGGKVSGVNKIAGTLFGKSGGLLGTASSQLTGRGSPENPMYVISMNGKGGLPGGNGPVATGEKAAAGRGIAGAAGRVLDRYGLRALAGGRMANPLVDAYLATQGGDVAPGAGKIVASEPGSYKSRNARGAQTLYGILRNLYGDSAAKFLHPDGALNVLNTGKAVAGIAGSGNPVAVQMLKQLSGAYPNIAAAVKKLEAQVGPLGANVGNALNQGVDKKIRSDLAGVASRDARVAVSQIARNAATAAGSGGESIGAALADGVARGIAGHSAHALAAAGKLTSQAVGEMQRAGLISSPSKKTTYLGLMLAAGLSRGMNMGRKDVSDTARQMMGTILGNFQASASLGNLSTSGVDALGASGSTPLTAASIVKFLGGQRSQDRSYVRNLALARKRGVGSGLLQEIAQMEPTQGAAYAAALAHATPAQVRAINSDEKAIAQYGRQAGGLVTLSQRTIDQLSRGIAHGVSHLSIHVSAHKLDRHNGVAVVISP